MPYCQRVSQPEDLWPVAVVLPFYRHLRELPCQRGARAAGNWDTINAFRGRMGIRVKDDRTRSAAATSVFAFRNRDRRSLVAALERIAAIAPRMSHREFQNLAYQLGHETADPADDGEIRVTMTAGNQDQLAERARRAARLAGAVRGGPMVAGAGVRVSYGARGRVVLVFPGDAVTGSGAQGRTAGTAGETATLARSLGLLRRLEGLGVSATAAVGHGLGEIAGLVWAGSLPAPEAARLVAQHGEVRRGLAAARTAMVRVIADEATVTRLRAPCGLMVAADEGPRSHVLAGPVSGVRELTQQAAALGVTASVLNAAHALHTPAMTPCAAPLRSVLAQVPFGPPRRRLLSTVTGRELTAQDDIAAVLCAQLTSPVRFREALQAAADGADLILLVGADEALAAAAAVYGVPVAGLGAPVAGLGVPVARFPAAGGTAGAGAGRDLLAPGWLAAEDAAALFTAGAMPDVTDLAPEPAEPADVRPLVTAREPGRGPGRFLENVTGLRMRDAGPLPGSGPADGYLLPPDAQPAGVAADLQALRPAAVPQQQVESLSRAR